MSELITAGDASAISKPFRALVLRPRPDEDEALTDYLSRLAYANGLATYELIAVIRGSSDDHAGTLSKLLLLNDLPAFGGPPVPKLNIPTRDYGLRVADFTHLRHRFCPLCITESARMHPHWRLKIITACHRHRCWLIDSCRHCGVGATIPMILSRRCECGHRYEDSTSAPIDGSSLKACSRELTVMQVRMCKLLEDALHGVVIFRSESVAVSMTLTQLSRLIMMLGLASSHHQPTDRRTGQIGGIEHIPTSRDIFVDASSALDDWPQGLWRCMERCLASAPADANIQKAFGAIYRVIYRELRDPIYQFLRDAFELFLLEHWRGELCGRHRLFREDTLEFHRYVGLAKVCREMGIGRGHLRNLIHRDYLPEHRIKRTEKREWITVSVSHLRNFIPDPDEYVDLRRCAKLLTLKPSRVRQLLALGVLQADKKPEHHAQRWFFSRSVLEKFLQRLRAQSVSRPVLISSELMRHVTLNQVFRFWHLTPQEIRALFSAMQTGELSFHFDMHQRLPLLTFDEMGLRSWLENMRRIPHDWMDVQEAARRLGVKEQIVYELVAKNFLQADLQHRSHRMQKRIHVASLSNFANEYIKLSDLAKLHATTPSAVLARIGVQPATGRTIDGGRQYFFRRSDLPEKWLTAT